MITNCKLTESINVKIYFVMLITNVKPYRYINFSAKILL